ncbi:MAG: hypothetical protein ACREM2_05235 [Vulcanimicrobiaceae bacterium]
MLRAYRDWLVAELALLANASHHAYAFGQANMAKRALERLDAEIAGRVVLSLEREQARAALAALPADEALGPLRTALAAALGDPV